MRKSPSGGFPPFSTGFSGSRPPSPKTLQPIAFDTLSHSGYIFLHPALTDSNPGVDAPIYEYSGNISTWASNSIALDALTISFSYSRSEVPLGPSFPVVGTMTLNVAQGVSLANATISTTLPQQASCTGIALAVPFINTTTPRMNGVAQPTSLNNLVIQATNLGSGSYASSFTFFLPQRDAANALILPVGSTSATAATTPQTLSLTATYRLQSGVNVTRTILSSSSRVTARYFVSAVSSTIQTDRSSPGVTPSDTMRWTISYSISNYYNATNLILEADVSDGHRFNSAEVAPQASFGAAPIAINPTVNLTDIGNDLNPETQGLTRLRFNITSARLAASLPAALNGPLLSGSISFSTSILEQYSDNPFGRTVYHRDSVNVGTRLLDRATLAYTSSGSTSVIAGTPQLTFYAVNGSTTVPATPNVIAVRSRSQFGYPLFPHFATNTSFCFRAWR
jgi:hypothetical protein